MLLAWSADTVGQGWGINREWGGMRIYETMRQARPDVFVHCGDTIYADQPLPAGGEARRRHDLAQRGHRRPSRRSAETLDDFRGNYLYNLLDENVRRFNAEVPQIVLWDDHEVRDNWYPQEVLADAALHGGSVRARWPRARARRSSSTSRSAWRPRRSAGRIYRSFDYGPSLEVFALDLRSYRGPNSPNGSRSPARTRRSSARRRSRWLAGDCAPRGRPGR